MNNPILGTYIPPIAASDSSTLAIDKTGHATLLANATYYFPLGDDTTSTSTVDRNMSSVRRASLERAQVQWDALVAMTVTIEDTIWPDVSPSSTVAGDWLQQNPSTAYVPVTGGSAVNATVTVAGGSLGGCGYDLGNFGGSRLRVKLVVGATGGSVRVGQCGKA